MKNNFENAFNDLLVDTFHLILKTELKMIKEITDHDLSMREIHLIEIIGKKDGLITISDVAQTFQITLASVTVMVNKLNKLHYVKKVKNNDDARSVLLSLTDKGKSIDKIHYEFHKKMVENISHGLTDLERNVCVNVVQKLNDFFKNELD